MGAVKAVSRPTLGRPGAPVGRLLRAIRAQAVRPDDIVIVDGGSTDGTLGVISETSL
jgi:glycosyltransferase involved in cell wall biosynthesis